LGLSSILSQVSNPPVNFTRLKFDQPLGGMVPINELLSTSNSDRLLRLEKKFEGMSPLSLESMMESEFRFG